MEALATRERIVAHGLELAALDGLEGVTIGRLAADLELSKAGVLGHFGTKERLQLSVVEAAADAFREHVVDPYRELPRGLERLRAVCDAWAEYAGEAVGGCFFTAAAAEFDGRGGPVRDKLVELVGGWYAWLERQVEAAVAAGDLPADTDPAQVVFEVKAAIMALSQESQLFCDPRALDRARRAMRHALESCAFSRVGRA